MNENKTIETTDIYCKCPFCKKTLRLYGKIRCEHFVRIYHPDEESYIVWEFKNEEAINV